MFARKAARYYKIGKTPVLFQFTKEKETKKNILITGNKFNERRR